MLPYAQVAAAKKGRGRGGGEDMLPEDLDEDAAAAGDAGDEKEEEEDISKDAMVKVYTIINGILLVTNFTVIVYVYINITNCIVRVKGKGTD
jgi:hypothetical protein